MKKLLALAAFAVFGTLSVQAQFPGLDKTPADIAYYPENAAKRIFAKTIEQKVSLEPKIKIIYSRPAKKGRTIFGDLVPFNEPWRVGANEQAEITFYQNVKFGDKNVKAGTYTLFIIPTAESWTIILNNELDIWGAYKYNKTRDVARVTVPVAKTNSVIENFSIQMVEKGEKLAHINFGWDRTFVEVPVSFRSNLW